MNTFWSTLGQPYVIATGILALLTMALCVATALVRRPERMTNRTAWIIVVVLFVLGFVVAIILAVINTNNNTGPEVSRDSITLWPNQDRGPASGYVQENETLSKVALNSRLGDKGTPSGSERDFVSLRDLKGGAESTKDPVKLYDKDEVWVYLNIRNDSSSLSGASAKGVYASLVLPVEFSTSWLENATIWSENSTPRSIWSQITAVTEDDTKRFRLSYVPDTAFYYKDKDDKTGAALSDSLFTVDGAQVGCSQLDGVIPPGDSCAGRVGFRLRLEFEADSLASLTADSRVKMTEDKRWGTNIWAMPGDTVDYRLHIRNSSSVDLRQVDLTARLNDLGSYIKGSTRKGQAGDAEVVDGIVDSGLTVDSIAFNSDYYISFSVKTPASITDCTLHEYKIRTYIQPTGFTSTSSSATVYIQGTCTD